MAKTGFKKGDIIVYPLHGVGNILKIEKSKVSGEMLVYYNIKMYNTEMSVRIPVGKDIDIGIRKITNRKNISKMYNSLRRLPKNIEKDWKKRFQNNTDKLKEGSIDSISEVVKELYLRNHVKALSIMEKKQYENALNLLLDEVAISSRTEKADVKKTILKFLANLLNKYTK
ncbi:CarD family transcriptional regulator [Spirochaetota bacterium]